MKSIAQSAYAPLISAHSSKITNAEFMAGIFGHYGDKLQGSKPQVLSFGGIPKEHTAWGGRRWIPSMKLDFQNQNAYFTLAVYGPGHTKQEADCVAICGVMLDDLGTKSAPLSRLDGCPPSFVIETSQGNHQVGYLFAEPQTDLAQVSGLNRAAVAAGLSDPGAQSPATRWGRLPVANNQKYEPPFPCRLVGWNPERRYSIQQIAEGLGLTMEVPDSASTNGKTSASAKATDNDDDGADVWERLEELRDVRTVAEVARSVRFEIANSPQGRVAKIVEVRAKKVAGRDVVDHSAAAWSFCCEMIRQGADFDGVVELWSGELGEGVRHHDEKKNFKKPKWRATTILGAARDVLAKLSRPPAPAIPAEVLASGDQIKFTHGGRIDPNEGNVVAILRNDKRVKGLIGFNQLSQRPERRGSFKVFDRGGCDKPGGLTDDDCVRVSMWLANVFDIRADFRTLVRALEVVAMDAKFDPLADRLRELSTRWDGVPRVDTWLAKYLKVDITDCAEYVGAAGRCFLVGAVARALDPGCKMDTILAIEGAPGGRKSTALAVLADAVMADLFTDGVHDVSNQVTLVETTGGKWLVEVAELAGVRRAADVEALKAAVTRRVDKVRRPYAIMPVEVPRRFVFSATTNKNGGYLCDPSGALARRFHPVKTLATETAPIDVERLAEDAGQIWGEAVRLFEAGVRWFISESDGLAYSQWREGRETRNAKGPFYNEVFECLKEWTDEGLHGGHSLKEIAKVVGDERTVETGGVGASATGLVGTLEAFGMFNKKSNGNMKWFFTEEAGKRFHELRLADLREAGMVKPPKSNLWTA